MQEKGDLAPDVPNRPPRKIDPDRLKAYLAEHPDAYLEEIAQQFGCWESAIRKALKRLKITRKKRPRDTKNRTLTK